MKNRIRKSVLILAFSISATGVFAQKYLDKTAEVSFFSSTPMEDIDAKNSSAVSAMDAASGAIEFAVLIKGFQLKRH